MCLILFAFQTHPDYRLVVAANRDESYKRPTAPAGFWEDAPHVLGGRDLLHGGTWLGVTRDGRFAAVSNYREGPAPPTTGPSRGSLTADFLRGNEPPRAYLERVAAAGALYPGFNLIIGDQRELYYFSNRAGGLQRLTPGVYGLSNAELDSPWPKVEVGKRLLGAQARAGAEPQVESLLAGLTDRRTPSDERLPDTGVGLQRERQLASIFIRGESYGTRSSTVVLITRQGLVRFVERNYDPKTLAPTTIRHQFALSPASAGTPEPVDGSDGSSGEPSVDLQRLPGDKGGLI